MELWMSEMQKWGVVAGGIFTAITALLIANGNASLRKPVPVRVAAEKLQQAWADHHTYA
jgi:hypothetical protein